MPLVPAACARRSQRASAQDSPPRSAPLPDPALVTKNVISFEVEVSGEGVEPSGFGDESVPGFTAGTQTLPEDTHAVLVLDQAGWHGAKALQLPDSLTQVPLPAFSPDLNPVERVWLYLRERYLSHRLLADYDADRMP